MKRARRSTLIPSHIAYAYCSLLNFWIALVANAFLPVTIHLAQRSSILRIGSYRLLRKLRKSNPLRVYFIEDNSDKRPRRLKAADSPTQSNNLQQKRVDHYYQSKNDKVMDWRDEWGVEYSHGANIDNYFPSTVEDVTDTIVSTISCVLRKNATNLDPNVIQNTVHGDNTMGYRPVRHKTHDIGRIGIELDWSARDIDSRNDVTNPDKNDYATVRYASLLLAGKLSQMDLSTTKQLPSLNVTNIKPKRRPIAIYFNTVQQALAASRQLWELKRLELYQQKSTNQADFPHKSVYDTIHIRSLGQNDAIPVELRNDSERISSAKMGRKLATGQVDPTAGLVIIVQPTNYNDEFQPAGPSFNVIESIQRLLAVASIEQLPVVMISPRFIKAQTLSISSGWDQSGYYQQSSLYAGLEPPKGPTPWILRDFTPPAFCYIANALSIESSKRMLKDRDTNLYSYYSHLSLCQSIFHKGHSWNLYAAIRHIDTNTNNKQVDRKRDGITYECIATSKNSAGRPTQQLMLKIWNEYYRSQID